MNDTIFYTSVYIVVIIALLCWISWLRGELRTHKRQLEWAYEDNARTEAAYEKLREECIDASEGLVQFRQFINSDENIYLRIQRDHELAVALFAVESLEKGNYELAENYEMDLLQKESIHDELVDAYNRQRDYVIGLEDRVEETERERDFLQKRVDDLTGV